MIGIKSIRLYSPMALAVTLSAIFLFAGVGQSFAEEKQILKASDLEQRALEYLAEQIPWDPEMTEVTVEYKGKDIILPPGDLELNFRLPGSVMRTGRFPLSTTVMVDKAVKKRLRMKAQVTRSTRLIKTMRPINRGEILTAEDVSVEVVQSNRNFRGTATRLEDVVGLEANRNLVEGRAIKLNSLRKPPLVEKGDQVTLVAEKGKMKITAIGLVKENGFKNSLVQVLNLQTKKTVFGKVVDSQTIKVNF